MKKNIILLLSLNTLIMRANSIQTFDEKPSTTVVSIGNDGTATTPCVRVLSTPKVEGDFLFNQA